MCLMLFLLYAFEITLTLPGIAGIILSIGMAVDANVIIFTRIKEEIGQGRNVKAAVKEGFNKVFDINLLKSFSSKEIEFFIYQKIKASTSYNFS